MQAESEIKGSARLDSVVGDLYAFKPERLPFARELQIRAFLLRRDRGNLLLYGAPGLANHGADVKRLGGFDRHYLNHWHESLFASDGIAAPVFLHEEDRGPAAKRMSVAGTFSNRHFVDEDFEVIPTPGHTPGATAYLWNDGEHRYLFTGDTIFLRSGEWVAALLDSSDRQRYIESLELIKELEFDVLVPWAATARGPFIAETDGAGAARRIDLILNRLRQGEDH